MAGGLNLYGFAGGDPINFSDPFGLCPEWVDGKPCVTPTGGALTAANSTTGTASSEWGWTRRDEQGFPDYHNGFDDAAGIGTEVLAAGDGVATVGEGAESGLFVKIDLQNGYSISYSHLSSVPGGLKPGDQFAVEAGQVVGLSGVDGNSAGSGREPHVHVVTREGKQDMNPRTFLTSERKP